MKVVKCFTEYRMATNEHIALYTCITLCSNLVVELIPIVTYLPIVQLSMGLLG